MWSRGHHQKTHSPANASRSNRLHCIFLILLSKFEPSQCYKCNNSSAHVYLQTALMNDGSCPGMEIQFPSFERLDRFRGGSRSGVVVVELAHRHVCVHRCMGTQRGCWYINATTSHFGLLLKYDPSCHDGNASACSNVTVMVFLQTMPEQPPPGISLQ